MQPLIKTRSLVQIRTHAQKVFQKVGQRRQSGEAREESAEDVEEARQQDEEEEKEEREEAETHPAGHIEVLIVVDSFASEDTEGLLMNQVSTASNGNSSSNEASSTSSSHFDMGDISDCYANKPAAAAAAAM